jgi:hypothetical protein
MTSSGAWRTDLYGKSFFNLLAAFLTVPDASDGIQTPWKDDA